MSVRTGYILVVARARHDAFTALFFDALPPDVRSRVRILEFGRDSLVTTLAGAAAVVLTRRGIFDFRSLSTVAARLGIPRYYFLDDNFLIVREESDVYGPGWSEYTAGNLRRALQDYSAILLASRPLIEYFDAHRLHPRLVEYPPIAIPAIRSRAATPPETAGDAFRVAFFGGDHRKPLLVDCVYPAIRRLAAERRVEVVAAGVDSSLLTPAANVRVISLPYEIAYGAALQQLARFRIDALVHPTPMSGNNPYKNENVLINARAVGAVPILSNVPPYDRLGSPPPAMLCENTVDAWHGALSRLANDRCLGDRIFDETTRYCETHFSGAKNAEVVRGILARCGAPGPASRVVRSMAAAVPLEFDRLYSRIRHMAQRSPTLRAVLGAARKPPA